MLGTFGTPERALDRARELARTYGHVWVRHRRWTTRADTVTVETERLGTALIAGVAFRPELHLFEGEGPVGAESS